MLLELLALKEINKPPQIPQPKPEATVQVEKKIEKPKKRYYKVVKGDSISTISKRFKVPVGRVLCANRHIDNPDLILPSERLRIPRKADKLKCAKIKATEEPSSLKGFSYAPAGYYPAYQCTWLVWTKRPVGRWHDASSWWSMAIAEGYKTGTKPKAGAIGWTYGHVVYVESVNKDGSVVITEANYDYNGSIRTITVPASKYKYIY